MSVADNIAYGLKIRRLDRAEIDRRVRKAADMLELGPLLQRINLGGAVLDLPPAVLVDHPALASYAGRDVAVGG